MLYQKNFKRIQTIRFGEHLSTVIFVSVYIHLNFLLRFPVIQSLVKKLHTMFSALMFPMDKNPRDNVIVSAFPERNISKPIIISKGK